VAARTGPRLLCPLVFVTLGSWMHLVDCYFLFRNTGLIIKDWKHFIRSFVLLEKSLNLILIFLSHISLKMLFESFHPMSLKLVWFNKFNLFCGKVWFNFLCKFCLLGVRLSARLVSQIMNSQWRHDLAEYGHLKCKVCQKSPIIFLLSERKREVSLTSNGMFKFIRFLL
jgi:hypothetical protein